VLSTGDSQTVSVRSRTVHDRKEFLLQTAPLPDRASPLPILILSIERTGVISARRTREEHLVRKIKELARNRRLHNRQSQIARQRQYGYRA